MVSKLQSARPISTVPSSRPPDRSGPGKADGSFAEALDQARRAAPTVRLSGHAQKRLAERQMVLGEGQMTRVANAVREAQTKGADRSLVLIDNLALVVSVKNAVVITAMDGRKAGPSVFTQIDSAVVA